MTTTPDESPRSLPQPRGPYRVGRTKFDLVDHDRDETLGPSASGRRELVVWVWHPSTAALDAPVVPYLPQGWEASDVVFGLPMGTAGLQSHARAGGGLPEEDAPFPVLLFSPAGFSPLSYAAICEELASQGCVVVGVCHTYEAPVTVFDDGRSVERNPGYMQGIISSGDGYESTFAYRAGVAEAKCRDLRFVARALSSLPRSFASNLDLSRLGAFGHSLGGNAALELARLDDACRAAVNLDGANWSEVGRVGLTKPAMLLICEHPELTGPVEDFVATGVYPSREWAEAERAIVLGGWDVIGRTARPGIRVDIPGGRHANFADVQFVGAADGSLLAGALGSIDPVEMWRVTCDQLLAFFEEHLRPV
jgi:dienelactone hydrolase